MRILPGVKESRIPIMGEYALRSRHPLSEGQARSFPTHQGTVPLRSVALWMVAARSQILESSYMSFPFFSRSPRGEDVFNDRNGRRDRKQKGSSEVVWMVVGNGVPIVRGVSVSERSVLKRRASGKGPDP